MCAGLLPSTHGESDYGRAWQGRISVKSSRSNRIPVEWHGYISGLSRHAFVTLTANAHCRAGEKSAAAFPKPALTKPTNLAELSLKVRRKPYNRGRRQQPFLSRSSFGTPILAGGVRPDRLDSRSRGMVTAMGPRMRRPRPLRWAADGSRDAAHRHGRRADPARGPSLKDLRDVSFAGMVAGFPNRAGHLLRWPKLPPSRRGIAPGMRGIVASEAG